jgi:hypothetical protein
MCTTTLSVATRVDLDQAISTLQASQIGAAKCSIEYLSIFIRRPLAGMLPARAKQATAKFKLGHKGLKQASTLTPVRTDPQQAQNRNEMAGWRWQSG